MPRSAAVQNKPRVSLLGMEMKYNYIPRMSAPIATGII